MEEEDEDEESDESMMLLGGGGVLGIVRLGEVDGVDTVWCASEEDEFDSGSVEFSLVLSGSAFSVGSLRMS